MTRRGNVDEKTANFFLWKLFAKRTLTRRGGHSISVVHSKNSFREMKNIFNRKNNKQTSFVLENIQIEVLLKIEKFKRKKWHSSFFYQVVLFLYLFTIRWTMIVVIKWMLTSVGRKTLLYGCLPLSVGWSAQKICGRERVQV